MISTSIINLLAHYLKKRIFVPVTLDDFVLDVGGGDKPFWRANVILDKFPDSKGLSQRFTGMDITLNKDQVLVVGDVENMPFKDSSFDFIYCSHLLEHVINPEVAIKEIMRVGNRGYIELPLSCLQKVKDMPSHLWFTYLENGVLCFVAKSSVEYDDSDFRYLRSLFNKYNFKINPDDMVTHMFWKKTIKYKIKGIAKLSLLKDSLKKEKFIKPNLSLYIFYKYSNLLLPYILFWKRFKRNKHIEDILRCPNCKKNTKVSYLKKIIFCNFCQEKIELMGRKIE